MTYDQYIKGIHKIGTAAMLLTAVLTFIPALYIWIVYDCFPGMTIISGCVVAMLGQEAMSWFMEPTMYFPILGVTGSYLSSLSGNTTSMRIPVALSCQEAVEAERGTEKAEMAATWVCFASCSSSASSFSPSCPRSSRVPSTTLWPVLWALSSPCSSPCLSPRRKSEPNPP